MREETLSIRSFHPADQEEVQQLILNGLAEHFDHLDPTLNPDLVDITASYSQVGDLFLVAEMNKRIIATGALVHDSPGTGRIVRVTVVSDKRRMGIGQKIVLHLIDNAQELSLSCILVETNHDWSGAIALYKNLGFSEYDRDLESIHMALRL